MTDIKSYLPLFIFAFGLAAGLPCGHYVGLLEGQVKSYERVVGNMQELTAAGAPQIEKTPAARAGAVIRTKPIPH